MKSAGAALPRSAIPWFLRARRAVSGAIAGGAALITVFGLLALRNEVGVAELRARETARQAVATAARALDGDLLEIAEGLRSLNITNSAGIEQFKQRRPAVIAAGFVNKRGEWTFPGESRANVHDRGLETAADRASVEIFLDEAAYRETSARDLAAAEAALGQAVSIAKTPGVRAGALLARAAFYLRCARTAEATTQLSEIEQLLRDGGEALATADRGLSTSRLLILLKVRAAAQSGGRAAAEAAAAELLEDVARAPRAGDAAVVEEAVEIVNVAPAAALAARAAARAFDRKSLLLASLSSRGPELYHLERDHAAVDTFVCLLAPESDGFRAAAVVDAGAFAAAALPRAAALARAAGVAVELSSAPGALDHEAPVGRTGGLLRIGAARESELTNPWGTFTTISLASLIVLFGAAVGGGAWLLARAADREIEAARAKAEFLAGVTHELKTPLTSIRLYGEMLEDGRAHDEAKRIEYIRTIGREANRLTALIDRVLALARLERADVNDAEPPAGAAEIAQEASRAFAPVAERDGLKFIYNIRDGDAELRCDRAGVVQAILDLLDNARKYARAGGEAELAGRRAGADYLFEVADRGPGLPAGDGERIFTMFARGEGDSVRGASGLGIGLALARRIVEASGGALTAANREGGGAVFTIALPVAGAGQS